MIDPIAIGQTKEYVAQIEKNSENPTVWILGAIDSMEKSKIIVSGMDVSMEDDGTTTVKQKDDGISNDFKIVKYGLKGWKNFGTLEFKTVKEKLFNRELDAVPDDLLKVIPLDIIHELAREIWEENHVSEKLEKN